MAGEQGNPQVDYDNISSTKLMNKVGILELSAKIKAYIDDNSSQYTLPTASTSTLGGVKVDGTTITVDANGVISSSDGGGGTTYTAGTGIDITNGVISVSLNRAEGGSY